MKNLKGGRLSILNQERRVSKLRAVKCSRRNGRKVDISQGLKTIRNYCGGRELTKFARTTSLSGRTRPTPVPRQLKDEGALNRGEK